MLVRIGFLGIDEFLIEDLKGSPPASPIRIQDRYAYIPCVLLYAGEAQ